MTDDVLPESRRARELARRRRRIRWIGALGAIVVGAGAVAAAAFAVNGTANADRQDDGDAARVASDFGGSDELPELAGLADVEPPRALSHDDPLRVWVGGDSLAGALGPSLGGFLAETGVVATHVDYKVSSGLVTKVRDWPPYAIQAMQDRDPEAVVFMIGTNDATIVTSHDGDGDGTPDWEPDYRRRVGRMMDILAGDAADPRFVLWIGAPTTRTASRDRGVVEVNRVMREEASARASHVVFVDAYRIFGDANGNYTDVLRDIDGRSVRVRNEDGVHFTGAGADHLARAVFALLDAHYRLREQADPEHAIRYTIRHGGSDDGGATTGTTSRTVITVDDDPGPTTTVPAAPTTATTPTSTAPAATTPPTTAPQPATTVPPPTTATTAAPAPTTTAATT